MPGPGPRKNLSKEEVKANMGTMKRLFGELFKQYGIQFIIVIACIITSVLCSTQGTLFMQTLIDDYITPMMGQTDPDFGPLAAAICRVALFYMIGIVATTVQSVIMVYVTQGFLNHMRKQLFLHMEDLPISYFDTHAHGDIMSIYTNDIDTLRQMISQSITQFINSGITIVTVFICMVRLSIPLTIVTMIMVAVMLKATKFAAGNSGKYFMKQQRALGAVNGDIEEMISGQKVVKVFCHEEESIEQFVKLNDELFDAANNANLYANILGPINAQIGNISYVLCAVVGGALALSGAHILGGALTLGALASFLTFNKSFSMPINQVSQQLNSIVMAMAGAERIYALLDEEPEVDDGFVRLVNVREKDGQLEETGEHTGKWAWKYIHRKNNNSIEYVMQEGDIKFDHVNFSYNSSKQILHDITLFAKPGQKVAFVGATGAGKTTVINLINRFYDVDDGEVIYDRVNINKIKKADLRRSLGIVLQDTHLFTGTVADNIRYGKMDATDEEVKAAAKLANAHSFIKRLPEGYDTVLTGDGANLSQGQRQLLAIARAAIADPPALILDEATSSIDTRTEKMVQDGMDKLMQGRTTFVIAHRLSTIRNSDVIMVMDNGHIIERGNHEELMALKGKYYQLYTGKIVNA